MKNKEILIVYYSRTGKTKKVTMPHDHHHVLATYHMATEKEVKMAVVAALKAKEDWMNLSWIERASVFIKAAELVSKKYRNSLNASTMLGQGKNCYQAEIDAACEVIDYLRFNAFFASQCPNFIFDWIWSLKINLCFVQKS